MNEKLYFIAAIPHLELREEIRKIKEEFKHKFNSSHALKSPAHITLQMPFKRAEYSEKKLAEHLKTLSKECTPFETEINGFDCFEPRVIFATFKNHSPFKTLNSKIVKTMKSFGLKDSEISNKFHPHMTVATRDLNKESFYKAWPEFKKRELKRKFQVNSIFLLKHNGKFWDIFQKFTFN